MTKKRKAVRRTSPRAGLDPATGALKLDDYETALGPHLTRKTFLASPLGKAASDLIVNEPWHSWQLAECRIGGRTFLLGVFYKDEVLDMIQLFLQDSRFGGTSWEDFSAEQEKARHAAHWRWLRSQLKITGTRSSPDERRFPWGSAGAYYDPRNEESSIIVSYRDE